MFNRGFDYFEIAFLKRSKQNPISPCFSINKKNQL